MENSSPLYIQVLLAGIGGLIGVFIGSWLSDRQSVRKGKLEFYEKQLRELYSPLLGIRKEIQILSEFRLLVSNASHERWQEKCEETKEERLAGGSKALDSERKFISSRIEYDNAQLSNKLIPAYRELVRIFKDGYWLAEDKAKQEFPKLIKFVETWDRYLSKTHAPEVLTQVDVSEKELEELYKHIEDTNTTLRNKLKKQEI